MKYIFGEEPTVPNEKMHGDQVEYTLEDIRFTRSKDNKTLYITFLAYPEKAIVPPLSNLPLKNLKKATLLTTGKEITCTSTKEGLPVENFLQRWKHTEDFAYVIKL